MAARQAFCSGWSGATIVLDRPAGRAARQQHAGVLAGAVHEHRGGPAARAQHGLAGRLADRQVGRTAEVVLGQAVPSQHRPHPLDVERLARVARRDESEIGGLVQAESGPDHAHRLHGLVGGAGEHRAVGIPDPAGQGAGSV